MKLVILIILFILIFSQNAFSAVGKTATPEQLDKLCIPVVLSIDNDTHWFYYKSIIEFNEDYMIIQYGNNQRNTILRESILNWDIAIQKWRKLKETNK